MTSGSPPRRPLSVVIPAQNESGTIGSVIREARKLSPAEILVVVNGSTDRTAEISRSLGCKVLEFAAPLGHDVGRAIGAREAQGDMLLFLDGDIPVPGERLRPFVAAIANGFDIALNDLAVLNAAPGIPHYTTLAKKVFNRMLRRPDLSGNSLLAVPHALSRNALERIGWRNLAAPVVAQAIAIDQGLKFCNAVYADVVWTNRVRPEHSRSRPGLPFPETTERILGDHLEAVQYAIRRFGPRAGLTDGAREREFLLSYRPQAPSAGSGTAQAKRSAIIPVAEERATIGAVIRETQRAGVDEVIVVANGADEETVRTAESMGARVLVFRKRLGHNVGRAIGAACSTGNTLLFVDGDFAVPAEDLRKYLEAVESGTDIALNDLSMLGRIPGVPLDPVSSVKYFLNCCLRRPDLLNGSMTAVPHAMRRQVVDAVGFRSLMIPPLAQVRAALAGFAIRNVHETDVVTPNRIRPDHALRGGSLPAFERIYGDHVEAIGELLRLRGPRGGFFDGRRNRLILERQGREQW